MADLKPILLVEDNPNDIELTLAALEREPARQRDRHLRATAPRRSTTSTAAGPYAKRAPRIRPWSCST